LPAAAGGHVINVTKNVTVSGGENAQANGNSMASEGVKLTHFGYPGDANYDKNSANGIGDRHDNPLTALYSAALSPELRKRWFGQWRPSTGREFVFRGRRLRDDDSTADGLGYRVDVYDPNNVVACAKGGIFGRATRAILGEAGSEAVIPLKRSARSLALLGQAASSLGVPSRGRTPIGVSGARSGHTFAPVYNVTINGAAADIAAQVQQAIRRSMNDMLEALKRAEREDLRRALA
jgi:hypothetical protein